MSKDISYLLPWRVFLSLLTTGSMSRTAIDLNLDVSQVSRLLTSLETTVGRDLLIVDPARCSRRPKPRRSKGSFVRSWRSGRRLRPSSPRPGRTCRLFVFQPPVGIGRVYLNHQIAEYAEIDPLVSIDAGVEAGVEEVLSGEADVVSLSVKILPNR